MSLHRTKPTTMQSRWFTMSDPRTALEQKARAKARKFLDDLGVLNGFMDGSLMPNSASAVHRLTQLLLSTQAEALEEAAELAETNQGFTGANYCDFEHPAYNPQQVHDYGRGGCDARRVIAKALRNLAKERR